MWNPFRRTRAAGNESAVETGDRAPGRAPQAPRARFVRGEQPIMGDGQLGPVDEAGPERRNPEGTSDTPNPRER